MRQSRHNRSAAAVGRPKSELTIRLPADHRNMLPGEFYFGTFGEI